MSDTLTAEDNAALDAMRAADTAEPEATEAPATETPAAEPEPTTESVQEPAKPQQRMVPHEALHEERERRKTAEQQVRDFQQLLARFAPQAPAAPAPEAPKIPDFSTDPVGHFQARIDALEKRNNELESFRTQQTQQTEQQRAQQTLTSWSAQQENQFRQTAPDYDDAVAHIRDQRVAELRALNVPDNAIMAQLQQDAMVLMATAHQQGANVAERVYAIAKSRGYQPKAAAAATPDPIETIQRGQQLAAGLGSAGAAPAGRLTAERLANMTEAEFSKVSEDDIRRLFGG